MKDHAMTARERTLNDALARIHVTTTDVAAEVKLGHASFTTLVHALRRIAEQAAVALAGGPACGGSTDTDS